MTAKGIAHIVWARDIQTPGQSVTGARISDTGTTLLITGPAQELVAAVLQDLVSRGASVLARPSRFASNWTASCTKPVGFPSESAVHCAGEAFKKAAPQAVRMHEAGNYLVISGKARHLVQTALEELQTLGARTVSAVAQTGDVWMASCENPQVGASECRVEVSDSQALVSGPMRAAVAGKVAELAELGARLVGRIEQAPEGHWFAVCAAFGAGIDTAIRS